MLTRKQHDLLIYIHEHLVQDDVAPSFDEMKDALNLKSKSGIHRLINALVERGFLERLPNRARALLVKKLPANYAPKDFDHSDLAQRIRAGHSSGSVQSVSFQAPQPSESHANSNIMSVPLLGKIAAGTPIEAIRDEGRTIDVPSSMLSKGEHYALTIEGDSMVEAGIQDNDTVVIQRTETAQNGDIIVALIDQQEATLKRFRRRGEHIDLIPENRTYEVRTYEASRVQVQGKLAGLYREYN